MSAPDPRAINPPTDASNSKLLRTAMWVAIGALIAAAIVCVIWVLVGPENGLIGRAFLTILLLAAFAGAAMLDARLASRRPAWFALTSMVAWVAILLIGAFLIWMPGRGFDDIGRGIGRFVSFLLIILVLQLALLHLRLFTRAIERNRTPFITVIGYVTIGLVALLAVMLVVALTLNEWIDFRDLYWRIVVAVTILAAVGTALVPLINALLSPRRARPPVSQQIPPGWPTFVDGVTPLPVLPDSSPDWNAYYTGYPSPGAIAVPTRQWAPQPGPQHQPQAQWGQSQQQWGQPQWSDAQWSQSHAPQAQQQWSAQPPQQSPPQQWPTVPPQASAQQSVAPQPTSQQPPAAYQGYPPPPPLPPQ